MTDDWPEGWESIFQAAVDLTPEERVDLLSRRCGKDVELRAFVEELIANHDSGMGDFLRVAERPPIPRTDDDSPRSLLASPQVGPYRLKELIGEGGMGEVYIAEQEKPIRRRVALKVIKWGMDTKQVIARFESERQALALMDHPYIAKVLDAGSTEEGRPYFVMEHVTGVPITDHCDRHRLRTRERLELFMRVCEGVQHAHQKAIIHRDLKPSNILVTIQEGRAIPKIIDFGVAKATSQRLTERTVYTELGQLIGTPEYMSPEQAEMSGQSVDTRTDIYSLGAVLYELLVGEKPFDSGELRGAGYDEIRRTIREVDPALPSTRVSGSGAKNRRVDPAELAGQLRGDLDWITIKAMEKDRTRRFATAAELAVDIGRHLADEPVSARPPSTTYRVGKFVRRHRVAVVATGVALLSLIVGMAGTTVGLLRAREAERTASAEAAAAREVADFLEGLFEVSNPSEATANSIRARDILDEGAREIERGLREQPLVQARLMTTMGSVYANLGLVEEARSLVEKAMDLRSRELGPEHPDVGQSLNVMGRILNLQGEYDEALDAYRRALAIHETNLDPRHPRAARSLRGLGNAHSQNGEHDKAHAAFERALAIAETSPDFDRTERSMILEDYANGLKQSGRYEEAQSRYAQALALVEEEVGPGHPRVALVLNNMSNVAVQMGEYDTARALLERALQTWERTLGPDHPDVAIALTNLAILLKKTGEYDEALPLYERALAIREEAFGPVHPEVAKSINNLGSFLYSTGDYAGARRVFERALSIKEETLRPGHPSTSATVNNLAAMSYLLSEYDDARAYGERALEMREKAFGPEHRLVGETLINLGSVAHAMGDYEAARSHYERALRITESSLGSDHPDVARALDALAGALRELGDFEEARLLLERALVIQTTHFGEIHALVGESLFGLARLHAVSGSLALAESLHVRALEVREEAFGPKHPDVAASLEALAELLRDAGRVDEAERLASRAREIRDEGA